MSRPSAAGEIWSDEITSRPEEPIAWIWQGFIAPGHLTLLTSQWKSGKTTLLSVLLGLRVAGGELGGLPVRPGKTLIVSEEPAALWADRSRKHHFAGSVCFIPQPFHTIPTQQEWLDLVHRVLTINRQHGVDMLVIDPLAPFLRSENHARAMLETLLALGELQRAGMAVVLLHHPGRGDRLLGQAARGSGALLLEGRCPNLVAEAGLYRYSDDPRERRAETPLDEHNPTLSALRSLLSGLDHRKMARLRKAGDAPPQSEEANEAPPKRKEERWLSIYNEALWTREGIYRLEGAGRQGARVQVCAAAPREVAGSEMSGYALTRGYPPGSNRPL